jgi:ABC-type multidrug transport system permease subunit
MINHTKKNVQALPLVREIFRHSLRISEYEISFVVFISSFVIFLIYKVKHY